MRSFVSEIFTIKNSVTLSKNLVSFGSQVELLTHIAHIEELFVVFLEETINELRVTLARELDM